MLQNFLGPLALPTQNPNISVPFFVFGAPIYWRGGHRCANILAHRCAPPPIGNADQAQCANNFFFMFDRPLLLAQGASVRKQYWRIMRNMIVFRAPRLFSYQSPIDWALQTGNGNTLQKRRQLHKKINRHRSPRSGTTFEHLPAFSLVTNFKKIICFLMNLSLYTMHW